MIPIHICLCQGVKLTLMQIPAKGPQVDIQRRYMSRLELYCVPLCDKMTTFSYSRSMPGFSTF